MAALASLVVAVVLGGYALVSARAASAAVSGPMVFVAAGVALGPLGLGLIGGERDAEAVQVLLEAALTLVLFADAALVGAGELRRGGSLPSRLLALGLPLTVALGALAAWPLLPDLGVWQLALLGTVLAPTDASLVRPALTDIRVPPLVRQGINAESGLNDGLAVPFFVVFLAASGGGPGGGSGGEPPGVGEVFALALPVSAACGIALGVAGGAGLAVSRRRGWAEPEWARIFPATLALAAFTAADALHGSGFIAAWVAGLAFGNTARRAGAGNRPSAERTADGLGFTDQLGALLTVLAYFAFGAVLLGPTLDGMTWATAAYALLSLTAVRMLPVALCLLRSGLRGATVAYVGWFGPRGLASIVLGLLVAEADVPGGGTVVAAVSLTVGLSVTAHGLSAAWLAGAYGRWYADAAARDPELPEAALEPGSGPGVRTPFRG
ncbi:cation:proton antiporter [Streptomyces sp. NPDC048172]|uniref:cation:proton antiporter n=1 Tax=Streptomyces sp. NPDC048172 TaxID=3365505 RepID=UPI00371B072D